jgi:hypothetical protein
MSYYMAWREPLPARPACISQHLTPAAGIEHHELPARGQGIPATEPRPLDRHTGQMVARAAPMGRLEQDRGARTRRHVPRTWVP